MRIAFLSILSVLFVTRCLSQQEVISFRHYGVADGLSDNTIRCVYFDSQGFLWIGTNEGLNRFDGEEFFHYRKKEDGGKFSLCGNVITDVKEDEDANLWIATRDGGICHLNRNTGKVFTPILYNDLLDRTVNFVHRLAFDHNGLLYVCSDKGLFVSDQSRTSFKMATYNHVGAFYDAVSNNRGILVGSISRGISEIVGDSMVVATLTEDGGGSAPSQIIRTRNGQVWYGAWDQFIHTLDEVSHSVKSFDFMNSGSPAYNGEEVYCLTETGANELWLGMRSGALWKFNTQTLKGEPITVSSQESQRLNGNRIHCLTADPLGRVWVGTDAGLHVYNPVNSKFNVHWVGTTKSAVNDFLQHGEKLWIATSEGLFRNENEMLIRAPAFNSGSVQAHSLMLESGNQLWVGTENIIQKFDEPSQTFRLPHAKHTSMGTNYWVATRITSSTFLHYNSQEYLLYNAYGHGIMICDLPSETWVLGYAYMDDAMDNLTKKFRTDSKSRLWILGSQAGIGLFEKFTSMSDTTPVLKWIRSNEKVLSTKILCRGFFQKNISLDVTEMIENDDGSFWVGTLGSGLLLFEPEEDSLWYTPVDNSPLSVKSLARDKSGMLWMNASGGLYSFNPKTQEWIRYDERDGIPSAGLANGIYSGQDGAMYVGGNGFYLQFDPGQSVVNNEVPKTKITHLEVMSDFADSLLLIENLVLPFEQNFLTFHFTSLCFNNAENCTFTHKLDGLDKEWTSNGTLNFIRYNKLPFGEYTFRVKAINSSGAMDSNEAAFHFRIRAPYYLRWWFLMLVAVAAGSLVFAFVRYRIQQKRKLESVRNKIARDLHDDVGSALGSISFYSETAKKTLRENNTEGAALVLEKMGHTSREMIENMHDIVWAVNPEHDSFDHVMERMKIHAADIASSNNIKLVFEADEKLNGLKLSMTERKNLFLIFKEALYNSVKYSGCDTISVHLSTYTPKVSQPLRGGATRFHMSIRDNGRGFEVEKRMAKGNGLKNMKARADEMGGHRAIASGTGGTTIDVYI